MTLATVSALIVTLTVSACGANTRQAWAQGAHEALDVLTDVVDPAYAASAAACDAREHALLAKPLGTDELKSELAKIRKSCDEAFALFEQVRHAQQKARVAIDLAEQTGEVLDKANAQEAIDTLALAWRRVKNAGVSDGGYFQ